MSTIETKNYVKDRVIVITGASGGFGKLTAEKLADLGGKVVLAARSEDKLKANVEAIKEKGGEAAYIVTDVTKIEDTKNMVQFAVDTYGQVDVLVNNAGTMPLAYYSQHEEAYEAWDASIDVNFKGVLNGIVAVYDQMIDQGRGHVVNLSSVYANQPVAGAGVYQAAKVAVDYLTESLRQEAQGKIKTTLVKPTGFKDTGLYGTTVDLQAGAHAIDAERTWQYLEQAQKGELDPELQDIDSMKYWDIQPESLADAIVYTINQPWGVSISDITVRSANDTITI